VPAWTRAGRKELRAIGGDAAGGGAVVPAGGKILFHRYTWKKRRVGLAAAAGELDVAG
jgi:hypothetical protein